MREWYALKNCVSWFTPYGVAFKRTPRLKPGVFRDKQKTSLVAGFFVQLLLYLRLYPSWEEDCCCNYEQTREDENEWDTKYSCYSTG